MRKQGGSGPSTNVGMGGGGGGGEEEGLGGDMILTQTSSVIRL